jgi:transmembrane sensor
LAIAVGAWRVWDEPMTASSKQIRGAIADQAGDWFAENLAGPLDREARAGFIAWLKASPVHVEEYLGIESLTHDLAAAAADPELDFESVLARARSDATDVVTLDQSVRRHDGVPAWRRVSRTWLSAAAAAAVLVITTASAIWATRDGERFDLPRTYSTIHGEQSVRRLPDGSVLHLNTDSQVTVHYSPHERIVDVDRGQALFQVAHDNERRFRVSASEAQVVAVGTQFDVYRRPDTVVVTVVEGTVAVFTDDQSPVQSAYLLPQHVLRLDVGHQVEVTGRRIGLPKPVDTRAATAWLQRHLAFRDRALGEVAAEFNRYGRITIEIDDKTVRAIPISGVFDAYDTDSFAAFLESLDGVIVQRTPTRIRVLDLASAGR